MQQEIESPVKGIIFDLDGTLYRMEWFFRPLVFLRLLPHSLRLLYFQYERSKLAGIDFGNRDRLFETLCNRFARRVKISPEALRRWITERFYPAFIATMRLQRSGRPQLVPLLSHLKNKGIKLAVLSDYNAVRERLKELRVPVELFDIIDSCEAAGALKPVARPFAAIAGRWNLPASAILVIGDRDDTDGAAAGAAGMQFLRICEKRRGRPDGRVLTWPALRSRLTEL